MLNLNWDCSRLYIFLASLLFVPAVTMLANPDNLSLGAGAHIMMETISAMIVLISSVLCLIIYMSLRNPLYAILGIGLFCISLVDGFDGLHSAQVYSELVSVEATEVGWPLSRVIFVLTVIMAFLFGSNRQNYYGEKTRLWAFVVPMLIIIGVLSISQILGSHTVNIFEAVVGFGFLVSLLILASRFGVDKSDLYLWLSISIGMHIMTQFSVMVHSVDGHNGYVELAHLLRTVAYTAALVGLFSRAYDIFIHDKENASYLDSLFKNTGEGLISISHNGTIETFNPTAQSMFGYCEEEVLGKNVSILIPEGERASHDGYLEKSDLSENRVINKPRSMIAQRKDGSTFPIDLNVSRVWRANGEKSFIGIVRDITERKQEEERVESDLLMLKQAVEQSPVAVEITDRNGEVVFANAQYYKTTGLTPEEVIGQIPSQSITDHVPDDEFVRQWESVFMGESWDGEYLSQRSDGNTYWEHVTISPVRDKHNDILYFVAIKQDVTEEKNLKESLEEKTQQLEVALFEERQYSALHREFVTMTSHEFRTPLAIIDSTAQTIERHFSKFSEAQHMEKLNTIRSSVARMTDLIDGTMSLSVLDAGKITCNFDHHDLVLIVADSMQKQEMTTPSMKFNLNAPEDPIIISGDDRHLYRVFINLLSNAVKYSGSSTIVDVDIKVSDENVIVRVGDHGVGIPPDELPRLFDRFYRATTSAGIPGTGVGLYLTQELVEMHEGKINITSEVGKGTNVYVTLPLAVAKPELRVVAGE